MKKISAAMAIAAGIIFASSSLLGQKPSLAPKYKAWLMEEVVYIITTKERDVFQKLASDEDRDRFIEEFWKHRDPTPGTPCNEFRDEHYRRIDFANKTFGRGSPFQGWRTERGRIYIILGPPVDVEKIMSSDAYPMELWYYRGNPASGQAPFFRLLFYQKGGAGDHVLYDPVGNSPKDLVGNPRRIPPDPKDPRDWDEWDKGAYMVLSERVSDEVKNSIFSLIPGNTSQYVRNKSSILLAEVQKYPQKKVNDDYALAILEHRPTVEVSYSVRFIGNRSAVMVLDDPSGLSFIHYVLVPDSITLDRYQDKYFADLRTTVRLADAQGKTLFQQEKSISIDLQREEMKGLEGRSFQLYDAVPVIPGIWAFNLLLENTVSKEFTTVEKTIVVPGREEMRMSPLVLARKVVETTPAAGMSRAYQVGTLQVYPSANNIFPEKDRVWVFFQISGLTPLLRDQGILEYSLFREGKPIWTMRKMVRDYGGAGGIAEELPAEKLSAGKYTVRAGLRDAGGNEILAAQTQFEVTSGPIPGLWVVAQANPSAGDPSYGYILGTQYLNKGEVESAIEYLARARDGKPDSIEYAVGYARALLQKKEAAKAREILLPLVDIKDAKFDFYETLGKAARDAGDLTGAVKWYGRALSFRGNVVEVLNAMGECYLGLGEKDAAARMFKKSLEINPNQERIKALLAGIK